MSQITAIYLRVSPRRRDTAGQSADLKRWAEAHRDEPIRWYRDQPNANATGKGEGEATERPGLGKLLTDVEAGKVARIVVWRFDRLGRTAKGLSTLLDDLLRRGIDLISLKEGLDLATPAGRMLAGILASVSSYETEARAERILAGQAAARASGKRWGGSAKGRRLKVTAEHEAVVHRLKRKGEGVSAIARATGLSRPTIYRVLRVEAPGAPSPGSRRKPRSRRRDR